MLGGEHMHSRWYSCDLASPKYSFVLDGIYGSVALTKGARADRLRWSGKCVLRKRSRSQHRRGYLPSSFGQHLPEATVSNKRILGGARRPLLGQVMECARSD